MAATPRAGSSKRHVRKLRDPRVVGRSRHLLVDSIVLAICGVIADGDDWPDSAPFARQREGWFRRFLKLPDGVPAHDTFERVFAAFDPRAFERCGVAWLHAVADLVGVGSLQLVSAWATAARVTLGQVAVAGTSNEITAIPRLLDLLDLGGTLVTIDAIGCQKAMARKIVAGGGDDVLVVKGNAGSCSLNRSSRNPGCLRPTGSERRSSSASRPRWKPLERCRRPSSPAPRRGRCSP